MWLLIFSVYTLAYGLVEDKVQIYYTIKGRHDLPHRQDHEAEEGGTGKAGRPSMGRAEHVSGWDDLY